MKTFMECGGPSRNIGEGKSVHTSSLAKESANSQVRLPQKLILIPDISLSTESRVFSSLACKKKKVVPKAE